MPYIPLKDVGGLAAPSLKPGGAGYIPLGDVAPRPVSVTVRPEEKKVEFERPVLPRERIERATTFLQPKEEENIALKSLKWLGRMVISPFKPLAQDVMELNAFNEVAKGVMEGRYDPAILDEFESLKKSNVQIVGDVAQAVIALTPVRALQAVKGLPIISKVFLKTTAIAGAKIGALFGVAEAMSEDAKFKPAKATEYAIVGAIGGLVAMPVLGATTKIIGSALKYPFKGVAKIKPTTKPTTIEKLFPSLYEKRLAKQEGLPLEAIQQSPKLNVMEKLVKPLSPVRTQLKKDPTASYIGLKTREVLQTQRNAYKKLFTTRHWDTIKNIPDEKFSRIVELQEKGTLVKNAPVELQNGLKALRVLEKESFNLSKQAGADVGKWRFTYKNHFSHLWTGDQVIVDAKTGNILGFADNRTLGIQKLLQIHNENPKIDVRLKPRTEIYARKVTPTELSQPQFFKFIKQIADLMESNVDDVLEEVSMEGIARIKPAKTPIGQWKFRKGELGDYTTDPTKIYPSLWYKLTKKIHIDPEMRSLALRVNKIKDPSIRKSAMDLIESVAGKYQEQSLPYWLTGKITGVQAQLKLGLRIAPPLVNLFQRLYAVGVTGEINFIRATKNIFTKEGQAILKKIGVSTEVPLFEGTGTTRVRKWFNPLYFFGKTEGGKYIGNRNAVGLAGYYKGLQLPFEKINANMKKLGLPQWKNHEEMAISYARNLVDATQFRYDVSDFAPAIRNNIGKVLLQFKTYGLNQLYNTISVLQGKPLAGMELFYPKGLTKTQAFHQAVIHFGTLFSQGGLKALSFGAERFIPASVLVWMALNAPALYYGLTAYLGFDISSSATIELANLTTLLPVEDGKKVWKAIQEKNPKYLLQINPAAYRIYRALDSMESGGWLRDIQSGQKIMKLTPLEITEYGFGINPLRLTQEYEIHRFVYETTEEMNKAISNAKKDLSIALKNEDWELAKNIIINLSEQGLEIKASDMAEYITKGEMPRLLRDFQAYRKAKRPELFEIIKKFYEE